MMEVRRHCTNLFHLKPWISHLRLNSRPHKWKKILMRKRNLSRTLHVSTWQKVSGHHILSKEIAVRLIRHKFDHYFKQQDSFTLIKRDKQFQNLRSNKTKTRIVWITLSRKDQKTTFTRVEAQDHQTLSFPCNNLTTIFAINTIQWPHLGYLWTVHKTLADNAT